MYFHSLAEGYPIPVVTGPGQSGKTTLLPAAAHAALESADQRALAVEGPKGLGSCAAGGFIRLSTIASCFPSGTETMPCGYMCDEPYTRAGIEIRSWRML